jgi:hypothetical protein
MEQIRQAEPTELYIGADGPHADHPDDARRCERAREVATRVEWDCEVRTLFRNKNLGCKEAVSSAITWFFEHVDEGIILEDDCVPDPSFFPYCEYLLEKYRGDTRVSMVSGQNPLGTWKEDECSYHFSNFGGIWGWGTWSSMWQMYEVEEEATSPSHVRKVLETSLGERLQVAVRSQGVQRALTGDLDSWGYQWFYARILNHTLAAVPARNLVTNVGFGKEATHTTNGERELQEARSLDFPLTPPVGVFPDREYDRKWFNKTWSSDSGKLLNYCRRQKIIFEDFFR